MSTQDPKFNFSDGKIFHSADQTPIPDDEPVVVLRGKDEVALLVIQAYVHIMEQYPDSQLAREHAASMQERVEAFQRFQTKYPERTGMGCHTCEHANQREHLENLDRYIIGERSHSR